jgi:hypothetical protein
MGRKRKCLPIKKSILIVGEGICEQIYFKQFNLLNEFKELYIETKTPPHPMPTDIVNRTLALKKEGDYDAVWCIFDMDKESENLENYKEALKKAKDNNINVAKVFPCFELWLLLHFNKSYKPYSNCKELMKNLKKEIPDYEKSKKYYSFKNLPKLLKNEFENAIQNSIELEEHNKTHQTKSSICDIYKIIRNIRELI